MREEKYRPCLFRKKHFLEKVFWCLQFSKTWSTKNYAFLYQNKSRKYFQNHNGQNNPSLSLSLPLPSLIWSPLSFCLPHLPWSSFVFHHCWSLPPATRSVTSLPLSCRCLYLSPLIFNALIFSTSVISLYPSHLSSSTASYPAIEICSQTPKPPITLSLISLVTEAPRWSVEFENQFV